MEKFIERVENCSSFDELYDTILQNSVHIFEDPVLTIEHLKDFQENIVVEENLDFDVSALKNILLSTCDDNDISSELAPLEITQSLYSEFGLRSKYAT